MLKSMVTEKNMELLQRRKETRIRCCSGAYGYCMYKINDVKGLLLVVLQKAVRVRISGVAQVDLALVTVPRRVFALLWPSFVPAVPTATTASDVGGPHHLHS